MPHIWNSSKEAIFSAKTICKIMKAYGKVPIELIDAYKKSMKSATPAVKARFYETIASECPEAMYYFIDDYDTPEDEYDDEEE